MSEEEKNVKSVYMLLVYLELIAGFFFSPGLLESFRKVYSCLFSISEFKRKPDRVTYTGKTTDFLSSSQKKTLLIFHFQMQRIFFFFSLLSHGKFVLNITLSYGNVLKQPYIQFPFS